MAPFVVELVRSIAPDTRSEQKPAAIGTKELDEGWLVWESNIFAYTAFAIGSPRSAKQHK